MKCLAKKIWSNPENAKLGAPVAMYSYKGQFIHQYGNDCFLTEKQSPMLMNEKVKYSSLSDAMAHIDGSI